MSRYLRIHLVHLGAFLVAAAVLPVASRARAEPAPAPLAVDLEIAEVGQGRGDPALALTLTLAHDRGCASAQARRDAVRYDVVVCREGGEARAPVLAFTVERSLTSARLHAVAKVRVTAKLSLRQRVVVARVKHASGGGTEVTATAR